MKVGIVGSGFVGATAAYAMVMNGVGREIVLVDVNHKRAVAEADDIFHAVPFSHPLDVHAGEYADLHGCRVVIMAAGVNQKPDETRLQLLERNSAVFHEVIPQIVAHALNAVIVVATNPVDIMTHLTADIAVKHGWSKGRVLGSGTTLDTARFRALLGRQLGVDSQHIHAYVIGEHGDSEVLTWSLVSIGGIPLENFISSQHRAFDDAMRAQIDEGVRRAAYRIIEGKSATYYGIGSALARITDVILHDQHAILTICAPADDIAGVANVTAAMPHLLSGQGVVEQLPIPINDAERAALQQSVTVISDAIRSLGL